jgi:uncharacterized pyridoxal phosphate-containing UPF0001 family protein
MTEASAGGDPRSGELGTRLAAVRQRIGTAAAAAGREGNLPTLIVVTKFHPADDIRRLAALGVTDVGENRDQEASAKALELGDCGLTWHFVGQLQSKKAKSVLRYAAAVHSVDRPQLVDALARAAQAERDASGRAPLGAPPEAAFEQLARVSARLVTEHPAATAISAGMSQDLEAAIAFGATHLRIGSDILGSRPAVG